MNILHLSDIHFGRERYGIREPFEQRKIILENMIQYIAAMDDCFHPDIVLVTGDIAWHGKKSEFDEAYEWFQKLKATLDLRNDQFVFCPGNHDLNRSVAVDFQEESLFTEIDGRKTLDINKCDMCYQFENAHVLEPRFNNYNEFCGRMGMQPYSYTLRDGTTEYSYLIGHSRFTFKGRKYVVLCFNTAYLPYGSSLRDDQMFLGLPQITSMFNEGVLSNETDDVCRIGLFHHAERFLHPNEQCEYDGRKASLPFLLSTVDLALCGHTETGGLPILRVYQGGGAILSGGATYYNDIHPNSFSIIKIEKGQTIEVFSHYSDGMVWKPYQQIFPERWGSNDHPVLEWENPISKTVALTWGVYIDGKLKVFNPSQYSITYEKDGITVSRMHNRMDPSRGFDIDMKVTEERSIALMHAPAQQQRVFSLSEVAGFRQFVHDNIGNAQTAAMLWFENGDFSRPRFKMDLDICKMKGRYQNIETNAELYSTLDKLQRYFDVGFKIPSMISKEELDAINWLQEIKDTGYLQLSIDEVEECQIYAHNFDEIQWILSMGEMNKRIACVYNRKMTFHIFGTDIQLGECELYYMGASPANLDEVRRKMTTWTDGDVRRVEMVFPEGMTFVLVADRGKCPAEYIKEVGHMILPEDAALISHPTIARFIRE